MENRQINIVLTVLNEEKRIEQGMKILMDYLRDNPYINYIITIMDNGSTDRTAEMASAYCEQDSRITYKRIEEKGVGIAFKSAVEDNWSDYIGYMDIDMSTDINALGITYRKFMEDETVDIVNASRYSKRSKLVGRSKVRNFISHVWIFMLKKILGMKSDDSICGFKFFKKDVIEKLLRDSSDVEKGWFLIIEVLIRAERQGYNIFQLPVTWVYNNQTKVNIAKVTMSYIKGIKRLRKSLRCNKGKYDE